MTDIERHKGQFPKGVSGNPKGRPKGSRNKITSKREKVEKAITLAAAGNIRQLALLMEQTIDDALHAEDDSFRMANRKLVFDKFLPSAKLPAEAEEGEKDNQLIIKIDTVNLGDQGVEAQAPIEGEIISGDTDG